MKHKLKHVPRAKDGIFWKGEMRFGKKGKLSSKYIGPFKIVEVIGVQVFKLELPQGL